MFYGREEDYLKSVVELFYHLFNAQYYICRAVREKPESWVRSLVSEGREALREAYKVAESLGLFENERIKRFFVDVRDCLFERRLFDAEMSLRGLIDEITYFLYPEFELI